MFRNFTLTAVAAGGMLMSGASGAQAATACTSLEPAAFANVDDHNTWIARTNGGSDDFVTVTSGNANLSCEVSSLGTSNNNNSDNVDGDFFTSVLDWTEIDKVETNFGSDGFLTLSSNSTGSSFAESGSWTIAESFWADPLINSAFLLFKDGNNLPETFVGYKVTRTAFGDVTGTYSSMWFNKNGGLVGNAVSHVSLYGGLDDDFQGGIIPLPAGLPLLLSALGLGGLLRLRQRKAA